MRKRIVVAMMLLMAQRSQYAIAAFQEPLIAPHAAAMGGASLATPEDSTAMFLNVAGIGKLEAPELYMMHSRMFTGLDGVNAMSKSFLTAAMPTKIGSFGLGLGEFKATDLMAERTFSLGFARKLGRGIRMGLAGKLLQHGFYPKGDALAENDPVFAGGTSKSAFALDVGVMASPIKNIDVGFSIKNVNSPNVGLASQDRVPREYRGGMALNFAAAGIKATGELAVRNGATSGPFSQVSPIFGLEKALMNNQVAFRVGGSPNELTAGVGLKKGAFGFDYSASWARQMASGNFGTHLIGIRYSFAGLKNRKFGSARTPDSSNAKGPWAGVKSRAVEQTLESPNGPWAASTTKKAGKGGI